MSSVSPAQQFDLDDVSRLLEDVNKQVEALRSGDARAREAAVTSARALATMLETPSEAIVRMTWNEPAHLATIRTAVDMRLFESLAAEDSSPKNSTQLGAACSAEPHLVGRLMKHLAAMGTVREVDVDIYTTTPLSRAMAEPMFQESVVLMHDFCIAGNLKTADFFREHGYTNPTDPLNSPIQYAYGARGKTHMIQLLEQYGQSRGLASIMATWMLNRPHWSDNALGFYPVKQRLIEGAASSNDDDDTAVFLVDVGGSKGHDLTKFLERHSFDSFPGHLVLQDRREVIDLIPPGSLDSRIRAAAHDFFMPQPVKGARVYFMHSIIHDYPDARARTILQHVAAAMEKGYSKLLIWDFVLPDKNAPATLTGLDWEMMTFYAAEERSDAHWRSLLEDPHVGLKVDGIWFYSQFDQSVIEAELA